MWNRRQAARLIARVRTTGAYTPPFLAALAGGGAWCGEARILVADAARRGIAPREELLIFSDVFSDVRDLQALHARLRW